MTESSHIAEQLIKTAQDTKATDIRGYELDKNSGIAEFIIVMSSSNNPHQSALVRELKKELSNIDPEPGSMALSSGNTGSGWRILEWDRLLIHIFEPEIRDYYDIDKFYESQAKIVHY